MPSVVVSDQALLKLGKQINRGTRSIIIESEGETRYALISFEDAKLLSNAARGQIKRSGLKKLYSNIFQKFKILDMGEHFIKECDRMSPITEQPHREPLLIEEDKRKKYTLVDIATFNALEFKVYTDKNFNLVDFLGGK